jgi:hypothetical protein
MSWGQALGGAFGSVLGFIGQEETNDTNVMLAREARHSAENMSNTAYQRATADMRAAGLNPALMFGRGQAASSPVTQAPRVDNELGAAASSGVQIAQALSSLRQADALIDKTGAETQNVKADTAIKMVQPENVKAMTAMYGANTAKAVAERALIEEQIPTIKPLASSRIAHDAASAYSHTAAGSLASARGVNERRSYGQGYSGREVGSLQGVMEALRDQYDLRGRAAQVGPAASSFMDLIGRAWSGGRDQLRRDFDYIRRGQSPFGR